MIVLDDNNWQKIVDESQATGHPPGAIPRESSVGELEGVAVFSEHIDLLPESKWVDTAKEVYARGGFIGQRVKLNADADYQDGNPTCWAKSLAQEVMYCYGAANAPFEQLQGESLIGVTGGRIRGYYLDKTLLWVLQHGIASDKFVKQHDYNKRNWADGWEEDALRHVPLEGFDGGANDIMAEMVTALCDGLACCLAADWWGHAFVADGLVIDGNNVWPHIVNTHGPGRDVILKGQKARPDELYVIRAATYTG